MQERPVFDTIPQRKEVPISQLPLFQLRERLERQEKLLTNPTFLARLPDRGQKIRKHVNELNAQISSRSLVDDAAECLEAMSLEPHPMLTQSKKTVQREVVDRSSTAELPDDAVSASDSERHSVATANGTTATGGASASNAINDITTAKGNAAQSKRLPGKDIDAVRQRIAHALPTTCKVLSIEESADILQTQEKRVRELEQRNAAERLKAMAGKHRVGSLPDNLPPAMKAHRGGSATMSDKLSTGDRQARMMSSLKQSFVGDGGDADSDDEALSDEESRIAAAHLACNAADDDELD